MSLDNASLENMKNLKAAGEELLMKKVMRLSMEGNSWRSVAGETTNEEELKRFAEMLCEERHKRLCKQNEESKQNNSRKETENEDSSTKNVSKRDSDPLPPTSLMALCSQRVGSSIVSYGNWLTGFHAFHTLKNNRPRENIDNYVHLHLPVS